MDKNSITHTFEIKWEKENIQPNPPNTHTNPYTIYVTIYVLFTDQIAYSLHSAYTLRYSMLGNGSFTIEHSHVQ